MTFKFLAFVLEIVMRAYFILVFVFFGSRKCSLLVNALILYLVMCFVSVFLASGEKPKAL